MDAFFHERLSRSEETIKKMAGFKIVMCGAGSLGANTAENLARAGCQTITVIDMDRIEEHNLSTQPYQRSDIGSSKARVLANNLYRSVGARVRPENTRLDDINAGKLVKGADLVIDTFDNSVSRKLVKEACANHGVTNGLYAHEEPPRFDICWTVKEQCKSRL